VIFRSVFVRAIPGFPVLRKMCCVKVVHQVCGFS